MRKFTEEQIQELSKLLGETRDFSNYRSLQAVWFRAVRGMTGPEIEELTGLSVQGIRQIQSEYFRNGGVIFQKPSRGGRRRENLSLSEEKAFLKPFFKDASASGIIEVSKIKSAYEKSVGRKVHKTTVYRLLKRHGWRKIAPRPSPPKGGC